jgi:hypothetical protein
MWENTAAIHSILKENNYKVKFLTSSILKKLTNIIVATQFLTHVFDEFSEKIKDSKKTTKILKNCILIYLHQF